MQQDERNKLVLELIPNGYNEHMYDIIDRLMLEVHQQKNDYHPIKHDNVMVEMYLVYQHVNINKNRIQLDELLQHQQLYQVEYYHFYHTRLKTDKKENLQVKKSFIYQNHSLVD